MKKKQELKMLQNDINKQELETKLKESEKSQSFSVVPYVIIYILLIIFYIWFLYFV